VPGAFSTETSSDIAFPDKDLLDLDLDEQAELLLPWVVLFVVCDRVSMRELTAQRTTGVR
jgi:hypothetical protein